VNPAWQKFKLNSSSKGVSSPLLHSFTLVNGVSSKPAMAVLMQPVVFSYILFLILKSADLGNNLLQNMTNL
jgi:hypothetical protein